MTDNPEVKFNQALEFLELGKQRYNHGTMPNLNIEEAKMYALFSIAQSLIDLKKVVGEDGAIDCWVQVAK